MKKQTYLIIFIVVTIAVTAVLLSGELLFVEETPLNWNYEELTTFNHSLNNFSFTFSGDERDDNGNFSKMINSINTNYPNILFNINGGDLKSSANDLYSFKHEYLTNATVTHFNKPVLFAIGNHEIINDPKRSYYQNIFGSPTYYNFTENNSYFIIVDNANGKQLNSTQLAWLKDQLNLSQKYKYRFVFMHIPLYSPIGEEPGMVTTGPGGSNALTTLFDANNVTMIFTSHVHNYYTGIWGKTPYIISGGAGAPPENGHPPNHHYIVVGVSNNNLTFTKVNY
jgi:serine/threonine-protein phosphatase CPPED1